MSLILIIKLASVIFLWTTFISNYSIKHLYINANAKFKGIAFIESIFYYICIHFTKTLEIDYRVLCWCKFIVIYEGFFNCPNLFFFFFLVESKWTKFLLQRLIFYLYENAFNFMYKEKKILRTLFSNPKDKIK